MEWNVTEVDRKRLQSLEDFASEDDKKVLRRIGAKKRISFEDIVAIKKALPQDAPLFLFLNNLTIHHEDVVYKASAEFRAKTEALRRKQENMAYKKIVQSVDASQKYGKVDHMENFGAELRAVNRQLINIINIMLTVVCAFFFGFTGVQFAYPHLHLDIATRFIIGLIPATIVFFADLYFAMVSAPRNVRPSSARLRHYMKIYRLAASPDESWLAASDNLSRICLFKLSDCLSSNASDESRCLSHFIQVRDAVFAMKTVDQLLVCGDSKGRIFAYDWSELTKRTDVPPKTLFSFGVFNGAQCSVPGPHEVNGLMYRCETERLYVGGAADNAVREFDINVPNKPLRSFSGHSSTVCELASASRDQLLSASADGTVRVWDVRGRSEGHVIKVADEPRVSI
ncbi:WD domain, G-beta repeat protein [Ostertagia ostertagi]